MSGVTLTIDTREELIRTIIHEKKHVEYVHQHRRMFEDEAYAFKVEMIERLKKEGIL